MVDEIWQFLYSVLNNAVSAKEWSQFKRSMEQRLSDHAELYRMKTEDTVEAILVLLRSDGFRFGIFRPKTQARRVKFLVDDT